MVSSGVPDVMTESSEEEEEEEEKDKEERMVDGLRHQEQNVTVSFDYIRFRIEDLDKCI